jgi:pyruvate formate lyase activating enzyme
MISYGYSITVEELMKELVKDEVFFFHSGGGITLSGGEPLVQAEFSAALLKACKERQIGTAIETSLCVPYDKIEMVLPWLDHLYLDIKHMDTLAHRKYTGQGNELVLENLRLIDQSAFPGAIVIRIPLIPGINDDIGNIYQTARFCAGLKKKTVLELLPYHLMGVGTYQILGLEYRFKELKSYDHDQAEELAAKVKQNVPRQPVRLAGG